jgi:hypothetical protein
MSTLDDVADRPALIGKSRVERSPDTRAAIAYLIASDATALSLIENETGCAFRVGTKLDPRAASVHWLRETEAQAVLKAARKHAGKSPDIATATTALIRAAADLRVTLTEHGTAMMRAGEAAKRLDAYVASLRARGAMKEFTKAYRRHRLAAIARGEGFMSYGNAELRLRRALIPYLSGGRDVQAATLFADVFGS